MNGAPSDEQMPERRVEEDVEFGRYTLKQKLAAGGMGVVYVAEDRKLKRVVALKMIRGSTFADDGDVARFTLEAEAAAALDHPNIVPIYEVGRLDGQPFFTMKLIEGETLAQRLKQQGGSLPACEVAALLSRIARAVHHAHQRGVLHRDLKPGNILIDADGVPWLTDFGLAKLANGDSSLTLTKDHIGTPHYMAPEVADGNSRAVSTASDVWALGVMLWEMLCGMPPFHGPGPVEIMRRITTSEPSWPPGTRANGDLVTIARRCMEKLPGRRLQSAGEVADELDRWLRGEPIKARPVTRGERLLKWVRREPAMAALYGVLGVAMATGLYLWNRAERAVISLSETNERIEQSLRIATSTKLAGDARLQVEENPARALMLAVESVEMTEPSAVLPESASALTDVLQRTGGLDCTATGASHEYVEAWITAGKLEREAAQVSPCGRWLITLDLSSRKTEKLAFAVFELANQDSIEPLRRFRLAAPEKHGKDRIPFSWHWMDDSRRIVLAGYDGSVQFIEVVSPGMENGLSETAEPRVVSPGSLAADGPEVFAVALVCEGQGDTPSAICTYREPIEGAFAEPEPGEPKQPLYRTSVRRWAVSPEGVRPGPLRQIEGESFKGAEIVLIPGTVERVILRHYQDKLPALLVNLEAPDDPPVSLTGAVHAWDGTVSADGRRAAIRDWNSDLFVFDLPEPGSPVREVKGRRLHAVPGTHEAFSFSPDGKRLAASNDLGPALLYDLEKGGSPLFLPVQSRTLAVAFSANGRWLAAGGVQRAVQLWNLDDIGHNIEPVTLRGMPTFLTGITFSKDTKHVIAVGGGGAARRWRFDSVSGSAQPRHFQAGAGKVHDIAISPDEEWIAAATVSFESGPDMGGSVTLSRVNGSSYTILGNHARNASAVAFSRNGRWLVSTGHDDKVKVWDFPALKAHVDGGGAGPVEPKFTFPLKVRAAARFSVAFHPGDGCLYQVNGDGLLLAWDLSMADPHAGHQEEYIHSKKYRLPDVTVSPDGRWLAVGRHAWDAGETASVQHGNQVLLYDVSTYSWPPKFVTALKAGFIEETNIAFSADSRWLAAGGDGSGPSVWDLQAPDIAGSRMIGPTSSQSTSAVGFSPDGRWLAYGGLDGMLHLWNWRQQGELRSINTGTSVRSLAWFRDGRLATAGGTSRIALWDTDVSRLKALARRVAGRGLSDSERGRFRVQKHEFHPAGASME